MIAGYLAVAIPLVLTPGASTAVVLRNSVRGGVRAGVETAVGMNSASFCYGLLTAFGFTLALRRWPPVWTMLRTGGALYLAWLALQSFRRGARVPDPVVPTRENVASGGFVRNAREGFVTNSLNPSLAAFYIVLVPQFIPPGAPVVRNTLVLTGIHIALAASWHVAWAAAGGTLAHVFSRGRSRRALEITAGLALAVMALTLALRQAGS